MVWIALFSAVMETFIRIPHASRGDGGSIWRVAQKDMARSLRYIFREKPVVGRIILLVCAFNLFMSSMLIIGLPVILRQTLAVDTLRYGLSQGALAAGGLAGGVLISCCLAAHWASCPWAFRWHWRPRLPAMLLLRYAASC